MVEQEELDWGGKGGKGGGNKGVPKMVLARLHNIFLWSPMIKKDKKLSLLLLQFPTIVLREKSRFLPFYLVSRPKTFSKAETIFAQRTTHEMFSEYCT